MSQLSLVNGWLCLRSCRKTPARLYSKRNYVCVARNLSPMSEEKKYSQDVEDNTPVLQLTEEQLKEFKDLFDAYDTTKSGKIGIKELHAVLTESGYNFNDEDVKNIVGIVDSDETGEVDFEGFLALVSFLTVTKMAFDEVDTAQQKKITQQQLNGVLKTMGYNFTEDEQKSLMRMFGDHRTSDAIEYEEFVSLSLFLRLCNLLFHSVNEGDGLTYDDMKTILPSLGIDVTDEDKVKGLYDSIVANGKSGLRYEDFVHVVLSLRYPSEEK
jgi:Ca2+-binding EF-hand superfamily protein